MSDHLTVVEDRLIESLASTARGLKQNGTYALWLFVRACAGLLPPDQLSDRSQRRRLQGLEHRLMALPLPASLRRALAGSVRDLTDGSAYAPAIALQQLVAPAREIIGAEVGDALAFAARAAREATRETRG